MGKSLLNFVRTTLVGGALFLVPIMVLVIIIEKAMGFAHKLSDPVAARFPDMTDRPILLATALLVIVCFLLGLLARVGLARTGVAWLESAILSKLPGYSFIKGASQSVLRQEDQATFPVVLARIEDSWQFGFVIEKLAGGHLAVFIPDAPNPMSGGVYFMSPERVRPTEVTVAHALGCLRRLGAGAGSLLPALDKVPVPNEH